MAQCSLIMLTQFSKKMTETWLGVYSTAPSTKSILQEVVSFHKSGNKLMCNK